MPNQRTTRSHHVSGPKPRPLTDRFWAKVQKTKSCWLWTGSRNEHGYGSILGNDRRLIHAHRVSWELANGPIPAGVDVLHNCPGGDNPSCVNPAHLWLGTATDNSRDMVRKGRHYAHATPERVLRGERHGHAKLTDAQVRTIRARYAQGGVTQTELGRQFGVHVSLVHLIVHGRIWRHLL
jgi:hypothetical protein